MQQEINKENYKRYYFHLIGSFWVDEKIKLVTKENKERSEEHTSKLQSH